MQKYALWLDGQWRQGGEGAAALIRSPWDERVVAEVEQATAAQLDQALAAAQKTTVSLANTSRYLRANVLARIAVGIEKNRENLVASIINEAGKPRVAAEIEVSRAILTFTTASEEAKRFGGEVIPLDIDAGARAFAPATVYWAPRGVVYGITPFNFPLNLVAHKVAPALAAGVPIVLKPAPHTPGGAILLAQIFEQAVRESADARESFPLAAFQVIPCSNSVAELGVTDPRVATVSFTGSTVVGYRIQSKAVGKRVLLELGGNAAVIVHSDSDLVRAAQRCAAGGFGYAGQTCISVQRIFVQNQVLQRFQTLLTGEVQKLKVGDPSDPQTIVGPVIDAKAGDRILSWVHAAREQGAQVLTGGERQGNVIAPIILTHVDPRADVAAQEVFGPLVCVTGYETFEDALAQVNASRFGLQAGVFTFDSRLQHQAIQKLEVGGVILNEAPTFRADQMPYGGVKDSGLGREGVRYAMEELSERRVVVQWVGP